MPQRLTRFLFRSAACRALEMFLVNATNWLIRKRVTAFGHPGPVLLNPIAGGCHAHLPDPNRWDILVHQGMTVAEYCWPTDSDQVHACWSLTNWAIASFPEGPDLRDHAVHTLARATLAALRFSDPADGHGGP